MSRLRRHRASSAAIGVTALTAATPAFAHGDMAAVGIAQMFGLTFAVIFLLAAAALAYVAVRLQRRPRTSAAAVFRGGLAGVAAILVFAIAGASAAASFDKPPALFGWLLVLIPVLLAAQLVVSGRLYRAVDARALRAGSIVLAALFVLVAAFAALALVIDATSPPRPYVSSDVRRYRKGCEANHADDCNMLGIRLESGYETPQDLAGAAQALDKGCALGSAIACTNRKRLP